MDTNTCEECEDVDGEVMELGDERQEELHPPYILCLGGDRCRCIQIALLADGTEINVDEIDEDTLCVTSSGAYVREPDPEPESGLIHAS